MLCFSFFNCFFLFSWKVQMSACANKSHTFPSFSFSLLSSLLCFLCASITLSVLVLIHNNYVHVTECERFNDAAFSKCEAFISWMLNVCNVPFIHIPYEFLYMYVSVYYFFSLCSTRSIVWFRHDTWTIDNAMPDTP